MTMNKYNRVGNCKHWNRARSKK